MGVKITDLLEPTEIEIESLKDKVIAIDAANHLYMFLSSIRQADGQLLTDSKGRVTSHLTGLFSRSTNLMKQGIKLVYVFDGPAPELKKRERERRRKLKEEALVQYEKATEEGNVEDMKKYAARTSRLSSEMIAEAKKLVIAMGLPMIEAPCEGEAQAAFMTTKGDAYAASSQDADSLLFGGKRFIRNLSITGKRKMPGKLNYVNVKPELITLQDVLGKLGINQEQLIHLGILTGTDYDPGGIKGIGQKKALKLVVEYKDNYSAMYKHAKWEEAFDFEWKEVYDLIKNMKTREDYNLEWKSVDGEAIGKLLIDEHDFSRERVESNIKALLEETNKIKQQGLKKWFG